MIYIRTLLLLIPAFTLASCGSDSRERPSSEWREGVYGSSTAFVHFCQNPRSGQHPITGDDFPDRKGSTALENHYLRSWSYERYFWYDELPDLDPNANTSTLDYFSKLKTSGLTANGTPKDRFHFTADEITDDQFILTGERGGYGIAWMSSESNGAFVIYVEGGSPAEEAGIERGMRLIGGVGIDVTAENINEAAFTPQLNKTYRLDFEEVSGGVVSVEVTAANVPINAVHRQKIIDTTSGAVGYMVFNTFNTFTAENQLKAAFESFAQAGVQDVVIDLRYNSGGFFSIAAQLGYLVAGDVKTQGEIFGELKYNDKRSSDDQIFPFINTTQRDQGAPQRLTSVNSNRVYILTTGRTCSASEAVINGLRGIDMEVIQIGGTTCGKAHGFNAVANCGTRYFSIDFEAVNGLGFGDYVDGFEPVEVGDPMTNKVTGCKAEDDLAYALGDINEEMLSTALYHRDNNECPPEEVVTAAIGKRAKTALAKASLKIDGTLIAPEHHKNMRLAPNEGY